MIEHIHDIRDLLIATIGKDLEAARLTSLTADRYPDLGHDERLVAWVLDAMTVRSLEQMAELRRGQGWRFE